MNVGLMVKINKINEEFLSQGEENYNKFTTGLKLTVEKQGLVKLRLCKIVLFFAIVGLNLLMKSA